VSSEYDRRLEHGQKKVDYRLLHYFYKRNLFLYHGTYVYGVYVHVKSTVETVGLEAVSPVTAAGGGGYGVGGAVV
jgi:hypothetical protein